MTQSTECIKRIVTALVAIQQGAEGKVKRTPGEGEETEKGPGGEPRTLEPVPSPD